MSFFRKTQPISLCNLKLLLLSPLSAPFSKLNHDEIKNILKLISTLPEQKKQQVLERIMEPKVFFNFVRSGIMISLLIKTYPDYETNFFDMLCEQFNQIVEYTIHFSRVVTHSQGTMKSYIN